MITKNTYLFTLEEIPKISNAIQGHICMTDNELVSLAIAVKEGGSGDHLEIGTMWGGSAILTALVKKYIGSPGKVVVIDPFIDSDGEWGKPNANVFWNNVKACGVADRIELIEEKSYPFPISAREFTSTLIDGRHDRPWPSRDWNSVKDISDYIIFHDTNHPDVRVITNAIKLSQMSNEYHQFSTFLELERIIVFKNEKRFSHSRL